MWGLSRFCSWATFIVLEYHSNSYHMYTDGMQLYISVLLHENNPLLSKIFFTESVSGWDKISSILKLQYVAFISLFCFFTSLL